jgi:hypothetical protein
MLINCGEIIKHILVTMGTLLSYLDGMSGIYYKDDNEWRDS